MSLVNKFVFIANGEYYKFGQIVEATDKSEDFFLVKIFSPRHKNDTISLYNISQMLQLDEEPDKEDDNIWIFFNTEIELNKYVKRIETPLKKKPIKNGNVIKFTRA